MKKSDKLNESENVQNVQDSLSVDEAAVEEATDKTAEEKNDHPSQNEYSDQPDSVTEDAAPLESLLYDGDDQPYERETPEESARFEAFLKEYKELISDNLSRAKQLGKNEEDVSNTVEPEKPIEKKKTSATRRPRATNRVAVPSANDSWDDEITLLPETYDSLDEEKEIFRDSPLPEEEAEGDDFSIGTESYHSENGEFQLSIKFDESSEEQTDSSKASDAFKYDPDHPRIIDSIFDFIELFVITLVCVMILTTFIFKHSVVEGRSMQNTLHDGDSLIITDLFYKPERYDIVVFEDYSSSLKKAVVKRVIGLPGETVEVKINDNGDFEVYINGELLPEEYALNTKDSTPPPTGIWHIDEGEIFVMGDNRYNSTDSRDSGVGPINIDCILGKVILRFYPFDQFGTVD